jgi:hypothetical protein
MIQLDEINKLGCWDWRIASFDGSQLCIVGGTDLAYSHIVEVWISEVDYVSCPTQFSHATFRQATDMEHTALADIVDLTSSQEIIVIEAETMASLGIIQFFIVGNAIEVVHGNVYYYHRSDLKPGERLAPWLVKSESATPDEETR